MEHAGVQRVFESLLARVPEAEFRLVGTASCVLRGIPMPASDVDVLFRARSGVDAWVAQLNEFDDAPAWLADASQYFARATVEGITVELSTVEVDVGTDAAECVGVGPWVHFDLVPCGSHRVPAVALELRLVTEVSRQRPDRWEPIVEYFRTHACNIALVERGLVTGGVADDETARVLRRLRSE